MQRASPAIQWPSMAGLSEREPPDPLLAQQRKAEIYNRSPGTLTGYECEQCQNRGNFMVAKEMNGMVYETYRECECMNARRNTRRLELSGLKAAAARYRFDNYVATEPWQQNILSTARRFLNMDGHAWFFIGGAVGCGKTHICTAIACELMQRVPVLYALWPDECTALKAEQFDADGTRMNRLKRAELLYLDDFFKITIGDDGQPKPPTPADIRLAHELLNNRYITNRPTLISSERYLGELLDIDEALGGRIAERAHGFAINIGRDRKRDYRLKCGQVI